MRRQNSDKDFSIAARGDKIIFIFCGLKKENNAKNAPDLIKALELLSPINLRINSRKQLSLLTCNLSQASNFCDLKRSVFFINLAEKGGTDYDIKSGSRL